jgi:hypothetical protein
MELVYDPKCAELARYFLEENGEVEEDEVQELAGRIQEVIEDYPNTKKPATGK